MNVTDLKIKNLVDYKGQIFTITEIFQNEKNEYSVKIENDYQHLAVPADSIQPITINEDWLEKFGFMRTYSSDHRIRYERPETFIKYDIDLSSKKIVEGLKIYGNTIRCKYIHEFQNIFSSLFGKDTGISMKSIFKNEAIA
ncbi:MAG: hypothetical protein K0R36_1352 [Chryseobacterium sp.]|jgi:hypothetical protein|uniref:hypothetical protein n=1 Tax=Chryseobacterium sp. TaxID=1871047 RepID=UPI0026297BE6|nr:hypothetical protein [Chryseobacterium sp.]MDF2550934.1 hypothetical protein [Chryseobacterium sp.]MDF2932021.1 hypothetical protein [Chryseobacterium sp.]